jgi:hypothetical protein
VVGDDAKEARGYLLYEAVLNTSYIIEKLTRHSGKQQLYKHETRGLEDVTFTMIGKPTASVAPTCLIMISCLRFNSPCLSRVVIVLCNGLFLVKITQNHFCCKKGDNYDKVREQLHHMRVDRKKFTCINDDMNKTADPDPRILLELRAFYEDAFPFKSQVRPFPSRLAILGGWLSLLSLCFEHLSL